MSPVVRLGAGAAAAAGGGALVTAGGRAAWFTMRIPGREFEIPGRGPVTVGERAIGIRGSDLAGEVVALGAIVVVMAFLALLIGPRLRAAALAGVLLAAGATAVASIPRGAARASDVALLLGGTESAFPRTRAAGLWVTLGGAVLALLGGALALGASRRVPRLGLPEADARAGVETPE